MTFMKFHKVPCRCFSFMMVVSEIVMIGSGGMIPDLFPQV